MGRKQPERVVFKARIDTGADVTCIPRGRMEVWGDMPIVIKDNRQWLVTLTLPNSECPYLFFPRNIHGCKLRYNIMDDERCSKGNCMMIDVPMQGGEKSGG
jgi:hypothetical protein